MKKILATGAMLAYVTWFNYTGALAATLPEIAATDDIQRPKHHQSARHESKQEKAAKLAEKLGIDLTQLHLDLAAGIVPKEVIKSYGLNKNQLRELVGKHAR